MAVRLQVCRCLWEIASEGDGGHQCFAKKTRLDAVLSLMRESLTNGEVRHIAMLLRTIASAHPGIRSYLNSHESGCMKTIAKELGSFTNVSVGDIQAHHRISYDLGVNEFGDSLGDGIAHDLRASIEESDKWQGIRVSIDALVTVSLYTDDVYEELLRLLSTLLEGVAAVGERFGCRCGDGNGCMGCDPCDLFSRAHGPGFVASLLFASRIPVHIGDTNQVLIAATGTEAFTIVRLALHVLQILSLHHLSRFDILHGVSSRARWWSISWLMERSKPERVHQGGVVAEIASTALLTLSHMAAETNVVNFIMTRREFILSIYSHLAAPDNGQDIVKCQRVAMFLVARMAEQRRITRDLLFQEKTASLLENLDRIQDPVVQANGLILARNVGARLPDDHLLKTSIVALNPTTPDKDERRAVIAIGCELLANLLCTPQPTRAQTD